MVIKEGQTYFNDALFGIKLLHIGIMVYIFQESSTLKRSLSAKIGWTNPNRPYMFHRACVYELGGQL